MHKIFFDFVIDLWDKSAAKMRLTFFEKIFFLTLIFFEKFYKISFFVVQFFKKKYGCKNAPGLKIISVGNLTVGGTGKSVLVEFLVQNLEGGGVAIVSRGYGRKNCSKPCKDNFLVSDGENILSLPRECGDEPFMLAQKLHLPVVVGKDRYKSCEIINKIFNSDYTKIKFVILDDAYQNYKLKKDIEILLLDARNPFGNGYCLPAGPLREKDYSRADLIVLTHADRIRPEEIIKIKNQILIKFDSSKIFCGEHKFAGIFLFDEKKIEINSLKKQNFLVVAAIGSFDNFVKSIKDIGINISQQLRYPDHYDYSAQDVMQFLEIIKKYNLCGIITTQKDWSKLSFLIKKDNCELQVFVSRVSFEFLTSEDDLKFKKFFKF